MLRLILTAALSITLLAGTAQAEVIRIGARTVPGEGNWNTGGPNSYFDTYPGQFCGVKAIRVAVKGYNDHSFRNYLKIGRVYFAYQKRNEKGPFSAFAKINQNINSGDASGWVPVPQLDSCLKSVRVYASMADGSHQDHDGNFGRSFRVIVEGKK